MTAARRPFAAAAAALAAALALCWAVPVAARQASEAELKAAILANMMVFIEWPATVAPATAGLTLCHLSDSTVATAMDALDGKSIKSRQLHAQRTEVARLTRCHALYVTPADMNALDSAGDAWLPSGVMLVSDTPGFLARGAMINLELEGGRVVFDVDLRSARRAGLIISSKMLRLARKVVE